jgi:NifU-like protein involved in Fe-S cluster formation
MAEADAVGVDGTPGRGRYFIVYLRLTGQLIVDAYFECNGCGVTIATGSLLTEMIKHKSLAECQAMTVQALLQEMEGLPPDKGYCAQFAMAALKDAVRHGLSQGH